MRVTNRMLFDSYVSNMNMSLSSLMELNIQSQTQKRVNKPSDDPAGTIRILGHRDTIRSLEQYKENIDSAKGWLGRSDDNLRQVSEIITRAKTLAQQAATGTVSQDNREQISYEVRSLFEQLIGLANMQYEGKSLYAGHKVEEPAFQQILWLTTNDNSFYDNVGFRIDGDSQTTVMVQFYDTTGAAAAGTPMLLSDANCGVRYSTDGGRTFTALGHGAVATSAPNNLSITLTNGVQMQLTAPAGQPVTVKATGLNDTTDSHGTWLWVRPAAQYIGDDLDAISVDKMGAGTELVTASASGTFKRNVSVRIDGYMSGSTLVPSAATMGTSDIAYSYSYDGGVNWTTGNVQRQNGLASNVSLSIAPGGLLTLNSNGSNVLQFGSQYVIRARSANIDFQISASETVRVNEVGKDIFGGIYQDPDAVLAAGGNRLPLSTSNSGIAFYNGRNATTVLASNTAGFYSKNLFEAMGNLVGFLETNNQEGIQRCLENLTRSQSHILNAAASVGGRENRLEVATNIIDSLELNEKERLSSVEDADLTELMTSLAQQQIVYEAVLRSSSMIMRMNLMQYL